MFRGIEKAYTDALIRAVRSAQRALFDTFVSDAVGRSHVPHKGDTLGLDQLPENAITADLQKFDPYGVTITEERGAVNPFSSDDVSSMQGSRTFFVSDPFDRSSQACEFLGKHGNPREKVIDVVRRKGTGKLWVDSYSGPLSISGFTSAICCVRRGLPISAGILNHLTETITVACAAGIFHAKLPRDLSAPVTLDYVQENGERLKFPQPEYKDGQRIVTYIGKPERGYPANFDKCRLVAETDLAKHLHYKLPGGPSRVLYLSNLQPPKEPIGVVVANGEKLGEWMHWLPFVRFAHRSDDESATALRLFEVSQTDSGMVDQCLMMPSSNYSIFQRSERRPRFTTISSARLQGFPNPSKYRGTLVLLSSGNKWALRQVEHYGYREIIFPPSE